MGQPGRARPRRHGGGEDPRDAVLLTGGRPNDPLLTIAGRTAVMGYAGWLNSYGTDFGSRPDDIHTMYAGCAEGATEAR